MYKQTAQKLRLEPGGFGGHQKPCILHSKQLLDRRRIHGKRHFHICICPVFQFLDPADPSYKIDPLIRPRIFDAQHRFQKLPLQISHIQPFHRLIFMYSMRVSRRNQ